MQIERGVGHEMGHSQQAPLPPIRLSSIHRTVAIRHIAVGTVVAVAEVGVEIGIAVAVVRFMMIGIDTAAHFDHALRKGVSEIGTTVNEKTTDTLTLTCVRGIFEMTGILGIAKHE